VNVPNASSPLLHISRIKTYDEAGMVDAVVCEQSPLQQKTIAVSPPGQLLHLHYGDFF
jgi:hypothetical protein